MEPESTKASPITNEPVQPSSPAPETPAPQAAPAPETPVAAATSPTPEGSQAVVPPAAPTGSDISVPSAGSGKHIAATLLVLSLVAGGSAAAYYYWMNMSTVPAVGQQDTEVATSTESVVSDPSLRPAIEGVITSLNTALASSSYEAFVQLIDSASASQITKAEFEKSKDLFKGNLTIDLAKIDFIDLKADRDRAGYYFLLPAASSTNKTLGMIAFIQEATGWKVAKLFSKDVEFNADMQQIIRTDQDFSLSDILILPATGTTTP